MTSNLSSENTNFCKTLNSYLKPNSKVNFKLSIIPKCQSSVAQSNPSIRANSYYFDHPEWSKKYFEACHRDRPFQERWLAAGGSWDDKIVVDIGCGPGNVYATIGGSPKILIGVDISKGSLLMAQSIGYTPLLADAHRLPFISGFADLVTLNATLHHCDNMQQVLTEAARIVRPGGLLIIDHDPQLSAWDYRGLAKFMYQIRLHIYKLILRNLYIPQEERLAMIATEIHHKPGSGVTEQFFRNVLEPLDFSVNLYPHNHQVGAEALQGEVGSPPHWRYRLGQRLSGIDIHSPRAALSLMCVAHRN